jgi:hypothetical protein
MAIMKKGSIGPAFRLVHSDRSFPAYSLASNTIIFMKKVRRDRIK